MTSDLIQILRTCSKEETVAAAMELAHTGTDEAVNELIRMIEANRRYRLRWYGYDDQLTAIDALGETGSRKAHNYLNELINTTRSRFWAECIASQGDSWFESAFEGVTFTKARNELREQLRYKIYNLDGGFCGEFTPISAEELAIRHNKARASNVVYKKIVDTIQKMESNLR